MPKSNPNDLRALIAKGEINGFTLDTNIIDELNSNGNLDNRILLSVGNLKSKNVSVILADVVASEVRNHMVECHTDAHDKMVSALKAYTKTWKHDAQSVDDLRAKLAPRDAIGNHADGIFKDFCGKVGAEVVSSADAIEIMELMSSYFENHPPFDGADKKHEFPDAIALAGLQKWSEAHGAVLAISKDEGWAEYCEGSEYLYWTDDLGKALTLFHEDEAIVARCLKSLIEEPEGKISREVLDAIQRDLDDLDFEIDASAFLEWDASADEAVVESIVYCGGQEQRILASDADSVTFLVLVDAKLRVQAGFDFSVRDSIDRDYVSIGDASIETTIEHQYQVTVTVSGKGGDDVEIDDAVVNPATRLRSVDFGHVEPFYEPEPD